MSLDKNDLKQITKIVGQSEKRIKSEIEKTENRVISVMSREVSDLAEINRSVIQKVDKIDELEKRVVRLEHKMGIAN